MNPSRPFILRPVATSLLAFALLAFGVLSYNFLPTSALPEIDYPIIQVQTLYPGASPQVAANTVTAPLEGQFGQMAGLERMSSISSAGSSVITLQFALSLPLDVAVQEVQAAINAAANLLPADLPAPPVYSKVNPADPPVLTLAVSSSALPLAEVADLVNTRLLPNISQVSGVGLVTLSGGQRQAVRVRMNPAALAALGLSMEDARSAIAGANVNLAKGSFDGPLRAFTIDVNDQLYQPSDYLDLTLAWKDGAPVRLRDVAEAVNDMEDIRQRAWVGRGQSQTQAILVNVQRQPGANVLAVAEAVKELLPGLRASLPESVSISVLTDRTVTIQASVRDVEMELSIAVLLVAAVALLFLHSASAALIPALAVPLSLVGTFGVMYLAGFSLNNLTLMALAVAAGFVVDDAIVVMENISRHLELGLSSRDAALKGAEQIGFTIISLTCSLVAVLIPLLFMSDVVGRLFREFAVTLTIAILLSAAISLTLTPMMCGRLLKARAKPVGKKSAFDRLVAGYARGLDWVFRHQRLTLLITVATLCATLALYVIVPKGFIPDQDTGLLQGFTEAPQDVSFASMAERQSMLTLRVLEDPDVESVASFIGIDGVNPSLNNGRLLINLKPLGERKDRAPAIMSRLAQNASKLPGISLYLRDVQDLTVDDSVTRSQYQVVLDATRQEDLELWAPRLMDALRQSPSVIDVADDMQNQGLQAWLAVDKDAAARLGVSMADVDQALYDAFGQRQISTIFTQSSQYRVVLEAEAAWGLDDIYLSGAGNAPVPLRALASVEERLAPLTVNRQGQFPAVTISFNLAKGVSLGKAVDEVNAAAARINLPPGVRLSFQGTVRSFQGSLGNTGWLLLAAIFTVYIVLGVLYESYVHPLTILSALPSAGVGALLALMLFGMPLDIVSIIGLVLLIGIVKKNAIMMIDFALEAERNEGKTPLEAIRQACLLRFRPILMTTLAALFGALPLMLGRGMGSELRNPLGLTMVGGLLFSQVLTLFTTPVVYLYFDRLRAAVSKKAEHAPEHATEHTPDAGV